MSQCKRHMWQYKNTISIFFGENRFLFLEKEKRVSLISSKCVLSIFIRGGMEIGVVTILNKKRISFGVWLLKGILQCRQKVWLTAHNSLVTTIIAAFECGMPTQRTLWQFHIDRVDSPNKGPENSAKFSNRDHLHDCSGAAVVGKFLFGT